MSDHPNVISRQESIGSLALWIAVLTGPLAWSAQLAVGYMIEDVIACAPAAQQTGAVWGLTVPIWILLLNGVLLGATLAAGLLAYRCLRDLRDDDTTPGRRATWLARVGVINSILFALIIAVAFIPAVTLDACMGVF